MSSLIVALILYALGCGFAFLSLAMTWQHNNIALVAVSLAWPLLAALVVAAATIEVIRDTLRKGTL